MKLLLTLVFSIVCYSLSHSQTYSGNVIDAFDKNYLEGVEVSITGKGTSFTNNRGYFTISGWAGDTLKLNFPGFLERKVVLGVEQFLLLEIQDRARLLPTFQVNAEPYRFRFRDGKLTLIENEEIEEKPFAQQTMAASDPFSLNPNISIYGPISYFTKRNRQLRQYDDYLKWAQRRVGYLEIIDSDSVRNSLMDQYAMNRQDWDEAIIRFNEFHQTHEFLDWSKERVLNALQDFLRLEKVLSN